MVEGSSGPPIRGMSSSMMTWPSAVRMRSLSKVNPRSRDLLVDSHIVEGAQRVALQGDAVPSTLPAVADLGEHDLHAALCERERQHATGDAAADDEHATGL